MDTNVTCNANGLVCRNNDNSGGCSDWKVRFRCAPPVPNDHSPTAPTAAPTAAQTVAPPPIPVVGRCTNSSACATGNNPNYPAFGDLCDVFRSEPGGACASCAWSPRLSDEGFGSGLATEWIQAAFSDRFGVTGFTLNATGVGSIQLLSGSGDGGQVAREVNVDDSGPQVQRFTVNAWTTTSVRVRVNASSDDPQLACGDIVVYAVQFHGYLAASTEIPVPSCGTSPTCEGSPCSNAFDGNGPWVPAYSEDDNGDYSLAWVEARFPSDYVVTSFGFQQSSEAGIQINSVSLRFDNSTSMYTEPAIAQNIYGQQDFAITPRTARTIWLAITPDDTDYDSIGCGDTGFSQIRFYGYPAPSSPTQPPATSAPTLTPPPFTSAPTLTPTTVSPTVTPECASCAEETNLAVNGVDVINCGTHVPFAIDCGTIYGWSLCARTCCEANCNTSSPPPTSPPTTSAQTPPPSTSAPSTAGPVASGTAASVVPSAVPTTTAPAAPATDPPLDTSIDDGAADGGSDDMLMIVVLVLALLLCLLVVAAVIRRSSSSAKLDGDLPAERNTTPMVHNAVYAAPPLSNAHVSAPTANYS